MLYIGLLIGFVVGAVAVALASRAVIRRSVARTRIAERRARSAEHLAEVGALTGGLAHEIKNPLSTVGLNAELLAEGIADQQLPRDERDRLLRRTEALRRETDRLRGILEDFLEFAGELRIERRPADLNQIVDELVDFFLPQARTQGVQLRADLAASPVQASVDTPHLKQALLNLMLNATQAMRMGEAQDAPVGARELILRTSMGTEVDGTQAAIMHVIDTGPGIEPERLPDIFKPYFTTKSGGTGLGLPTARRIIEAHDGRLECHSEPGKGTAFTVSLPAATAG